MTNHTEVLNYIIQKKGYKSYLEIGTQSGKNFNLIECENKTGVDPDPEAKASFHMSSDDFFGGNHNYFFPRVCKFDCIFIDGLHTAEQARKDFINSMEHLNEDGVIVIHDTNPYREEITIVPRITKEWTGDVYKFVYSLLAKLATLPFDYGITIIKKQDDYLIADEEVTWEKFSKQKTHMLNIVTEEEFKNWI